MPYNKPYRNRPYYPNQRQREEDAYQRGLRNGQRRGGRRYYR